MWSGVASGVRACATNSTDSSSPQQVAPLTSVQRRSTGQGAARQRASVSRVSAIPWTRASCWASISAGIGKRTRAIERPTLRRVSDENSESGRRRRAGKAMAAAARRVDQDARLVTAVKFLREFLPGDSEFGDALSTGGKNQAQIAGRRLSAATATRPGVLREAGMSALQVWQALAEAQGRGRGDRELAIVFTDLVEFSEWALEAGAATALTLLRDGPRAIQPPVEGRGGEGGKQPRRGAEGGFRDPPPPPRGG